MRLSRERSEGVPVTRVLRSWAEASRVGFVRGLGGVLVCRTRGLARGLRLPRRGLDERLPEACASRVFSK